MLLKQKKLATLAKTSNIEVAFKFGTNKATDIANGDASSVSYTYNANGFIEKGSVHLHPSALDGTPSAGDIYSFYDDVSTNPSYMYDLVVWNDDIYIYAGHCG